MSYTAVLIDDEIHCTESLDLMLTQARPDIRVTAKFYDAREALDFLKSNTVDLIFLDIEMPGINGFELLEGLPYPSFDVIFVTAYDRYAIKAFRYSAASYLLKPVDPMELSQTIDSWILKKNKIFDLAQLQLLQNLLLSEKRLKNKIGVPTSDGLEFLTIDEIVRCESESNYTWFHSTGNTRILVCRTLKEVESILGDAGFLRIHHSHLINPTFVRKYIRHDGGFIVMEDGTKLSISRTKKSRISELLNNTKRL